MVSPRLTGLEFHWFEKGVHLADRNQTGAMPDLDAQVAALTFSVCDDAKSSYTGPESLRRVAARFLSDASASDVEFNRRATALHKLSASFDGAATEVGVWKRVAAEASNPSINRLHHPRSAEPNVEHQ